MRLIKLYIAISLDGKIAKPDGDVSWLDELPKPDHSDYGYAEFLSSVDTTLMGNNTYKQLYVVSFKNKRCQFLLQISVISPCLQVL